jgi:diguanylate cyclase (GGDEF)-like protein
MDDAGTPETKKLQLSARSRLLLLLLFGLLYLLTFSILITRLRSAADSIVYGTAALSAVPAIWAGWMLARRSSGSLRIRWMLVVASMLVWSLGMVQAFLLGFHTPTTYHWPLRNSFGYGAIALALRLLAICFPSAEQRSVAIRIVDASLTGLICCLAIVNLYLPLGSTSLILTPRLEFLVPHFFEYMTAAKLFVAAAAYIVLFGPSSPREYQFDWLLSIFSWTEVACYFLVDCVAYEYLHMGPTSPFDALGGVPYFLFAILAFSRKPLDRAPANLTIKRRYILHGAMPLFLVLAIVILSMRLATVHILAAFLIVGCAVVLSGLRIAITQGQYMEERDEFSELTLRDPLTQIENRRSFDTCLDQEWNRAFRNGDRLSLLFLDVDHFKALNDTYGHQQGDECLKAVASCIRTMLTRRIDRVYRYGGEEFAVILPLTGRDKAMMVAERIRDAVASTKLSGMACTISIGVAEYVPFGDITSIHFLIRAADTALYRAKHSGRNRVEFMETSHEIAELQQTFEQLP